MSNGVGETQPRWTDRVADWGSWFGAQLPLPQPRAVAPPRAGGDVPNQYREWEPLVRRFAGERGVDYRTFQKARRVLEAHLDRLSDARPDSWNDPDAELAFYLNAYNAIAIHQVLLHYPVASIRDIGTAFARPYPVGPENLTLYHLLYGKIRRSGDPRVFAAVVPAARGGPTLRVYTTDGLQAELDEQVRAYLERTTTVNVQGATAYLTLPAGVRWFGLDGRVGSDPMRVVSAISAFLPDDVRARLDGHRVKIAWRTFDWALNER